MATLSDIRSAVLANLGMRSSDLSDTGAVTSAGVTRRINQVYQFDIVQDVGGQSAKAEWLITTTSTDDGSYQFHQLAAYPHGVVLRDTTPLVTYTSYERFYDDYDRETTTRSTPDAALLWGRELILRPLPDGDYDIYVSAAVFRDALATDASPLVDPHEEFAVEFGATALLAEQLGMDGIAARYQGRYDREVMRLRGQSAALPIQPHWPERDF